MYCMNINHVSESQERNENTEFPTGLDQSPQASVTHSVCSGHKTCRTKYLLMQENVSTNVSHKLM